MLCAPIPDALGSNSLIRADNAIDGMTLKQLSTGILKRCQSGGLATSDVALIDCTMEHPFRHSFSRRLPRAAHKFLSAYANRGSAPRISMKGTSILLPLKNVWPVSLSKK